MLALHDVTLRRGPQLLFEDLSLAIYPGWRLGIIGRNGTGKTSLFALLLGELTPDAGTVSLPRAIAIATVAQEAPSSHESALDYVLDGDAELRVTQQRLIEAEASGDAAAMSAAHEQLEAIGGYTAHARAGAMLHGLGFSNDAQARPVTEFSGGWRVRLNLARALMQRADLLLLDEPTNHLDLEAVLWLQNALADFAGTLLVISHDRDFLDATTTHTLHLHDRRARLYTGNYSSFELQRAEQLANQSAQYENQQRHLAHLQRFVDRFRAKASKARQAQARLKMIERLPKVAPAHADSGFDFEFRAPARLPAPLVRLDDVSVGYDGTALLSGIDMMIGPGDRLALLGANGVGKTTLVKLLAGTLPAQSGDCLRDPHLTVGYFAQHQLDQLEPEQSPLEHLQRLDSRLGEQSARNFLGSFAFRGERVFEPVRQFSGGERARLALALLIYRKPNLLLLDEPTNHLDLEMRHALELALQAFAGAAITISHDRHLIRSTCDELWLVANGSVRAFDGDLDDYARWLVRREDRSSAMPAPGAPPAPAAVETASREPARERRRAAAEQRAREKPLRDTMRRLETQMAEQRERLQAIERLLSDPTIYTTDGAGAGAGAGTMNVPTLMKEQAELTARLEAAEEAWLVAAEALQDQTPGKSH